MQCLQPPCCSFFKNQSRKGISIEQRSQGSAFLTIWQTKDALWREGSTQEYDAKNVLYICFICQNFIHRVTQCKMGNEVM